MLWSILNKIFGSDSFKDSNSYWKKRYQKGGDSGHGSFNKLAEFKAEILNQFVEENNIKSVLELGCGDGNQLKSYDFPTYTGFDISREAINRCKDVFSEDNSKAFYLMDELGGQQAELVLSIDVIYHLTEDEVFQEYISNLFKASTLFVIVYSSNVDLYNSKAPHVKHRNFTDYVEQKFPEWSLIKHIPNRYPYKPDVKESSRADFFIYKKQ